jgi:hypothetical protein
VLAGRQRRGRDLVMRIMRRQDLGDADIAALEHVR